MSSDSAFDIAADEVYAGDQAANPELVETYEASSSSSDATSYEESAHIAPSYDPAEGPDLVETYEPASSVEDITQPAAQHQSNTPAAPTDPSTTQSKSSTTLFLLLISIAIASLALYGIHHFHPKALREITRLLPKVAVYWPQQQGRARHRSVEEGDELESKGLMGQFDKQPRAEYGEKGDDDEAGNGREGYREGSTGQRA